MKYCFHFFFNELKEFPELRQNPSEHLKLSSNNNNVPTYNNNNEHLGTVLLTQVNSLPRSKQMSAGGARMSFFKDASGGAKF